MQKVSQVLWCLTSSTAALVSPVGRFSMPVTRFLMPRISVPPVTATRSQPAHIQYMVVLLTKIEAMMTKMAHGITVTAIQSRCSMDRIRGISGVPVVALVLACFQGRFRIFTLIRQAQVAIIFYSATNKGEALRSRMKSTKAGKS